MYNHHVKRAIDLVAAVVLLIALAPLLLLVVIAIRLDSSGPAIYTQTRVGLKGRPFTIYKFRSMKMGTPLVAILPDPNEYSTRLGRFLRTTSLDECPQLWNIVIGDMSFVGPRPSMLDEYELNQERMRLGINEVRPGLTGYAQIKGRDYITREQKIELDRYYLDHFSFRLDLVIVCSTLLKVVRREGVRG